MEKDTYNISEAQGDTEVTAEIIEFSYPDRSFQIPWAKHNYDCEALIARDDDLVIFSKNHKDLNTDIYSIPKIPGTYTAHWLGDFDSNGLITGADRYGNDLVLLGYEKGDNGFFPYVWTFKNGVGQVEDLNGHRVDLPFHVQTEAITVVDSISILVTNEEEEGGKGWIRRLKVD